MLKNEKGNVIFTTLFMLLMVIILGYILFQVFGIFVVRRQAQNIADSASLAAIQELRDIYEDKMKNRVVPDAIDYFWDEVERYQDSFDKNPPSDKTVVRNWIDDNILQDQLLGNGDLEWVRVVNENWFIDEGYFGASNNGDILYDVCRNNANLIKHVAKILIEKNGGKTKDFTIEFPIDGEPKILLIGKKSITLESKNIIEFSIQRDVKAVSATALDIPFPVDLSSKSSFML